MKSKSKNKLIHNLGRQNLIYCEISFFYVILFHTLKRNVWIYCTWPWGVFTSTLKQPAQTLYLRGGSYQYQYKVTRTERNGELYSLACPHYVGFATFPITGETEMNNPWAVDPVDLPGCSWTPHLVVLAAIWPERWLRGHRFESFEDG